MHTCPGKIMNCREGRKMELPVYPSCPCNKPDLNKSDYYSLGHIDDEDTLSFVSN